jgi:hypothetical protein
MDFINKIAGGEKKSEQKEEGSSGGGGFMDKINSMAGGGKESEKHEDGLDKGKLAYPLYKLRSLRTDRSSLHHTLHISFTIRSILGST